MTLGINQSKVEKTTLDQNLLPTSSINKVCKQVLPENFMIQKDAKQVLQKATTVFISCLATTAATMGSGKTMGVDAVYRALGVLEFDGVMLGLVKDAVALNNDKVRLKREEYRAKAQLLNKTEEEIEAMVDDQVLRDLDFELDNEEEKEHVIPTKRRADEDLVNQKLKDVDVVME